MKLMRKMENVMRDRNKGGRPREINLTLNMYLKECIIIHHIRQKRCIKPRVQLAM